METEELAVGTIVLYTVQDKEIIGSIKEIFRHSGDYLISPIMCDEAVQFHNHDIFFKYSDIVKAFTDVDNLEEFEEKYPEYFL